MRTYKITFSDERREPKFILGKNKEDAIQEAGRIYTAGFMVEPSSAKEHYNAVSEKIN